MKSSVIFVALIAFAAGGLIKDQTEEEKSEFLRVHKQCQSDPATRVDEALIQKTFQGIFIEDSQLIVHMLCMSRGFGHINNNGGLNVELLKKQWSEHYDGADYTKLLTCLVEKPTPEITSWELIKCKANTVVYLSKM